MLLARENRKALMFNSVTGQAVEKMAMGLHLQLKCSDDFSVLDSVCARNTQRRFEF